MGLLIDEAHRTREQDCRARTCPACNVVGETTGDAHFSIRSGRRLKPFDLDVAQMFGHSPKTVMVDKTVERHAPESVYEQNKLDEYIDNVLQQEAVACKELVDKQSRPFRHRQGGVSGARDEFSCHYQIAVLSLDYRGMKGIATALGHAPQAGLASPEAGSVLSVARSLTNIVWAPWQKA